jgi:hypothetical protein
VREERRDRIDEVEDARHEEDALDEPVRAADDEEPDRHGHDRHGDPLRDAEELHARRHTGELGHGIAVVRREQRQHEIEGQFHAEVLADQVGEPLSGHGAHARGHLLDDDEGDRDGDERPEEARPELRAGERIRRDAAGVVVDVGRDDPRADHAQEQNDLPPAAGTRQVARRQSRNFFFHASGRTSVRTSSTVIMPTSTPSASVTGTAAWLYFSMTSAT